MHARYQQKLKLLYYKYYKYYKILNNYIIYNVWIANQIE